VVEADNRLVASVRLEPQVALPGGSLTRHSTEGRRETVTALKVDRFTVTNADFMYVLVGSSRRLQDVPYVPESNVPYVICARKCQIDVSNGVSTY